MKRINSLMLPMLLGSIAHAQGPGALSCSLRIADSLHLITDSTALTKEMMLDAAGIEIMADGQTFHVVEFTLATVADDFLMEAVSHGAQLTDEQRKIISAAAPGSRIYLENIRVVDSNDRRYVVQSQVLFLR